MFIILGMAYTPQYVTGDIDDIFIDSIGIVGAEVNSNLEIIIGLVVILVIIGLAMALFGKGAGLLNKLGKL